MNSRLLHFVLGPKKVALISSLSFALVAAPQRSMAQSFLAEGTPNVYPQAAIDSFVKACTAGSTPTVPPEIMQQICQCSIAQIQTKYTLDALQQVDANIAAGAPLPADITEMVQSCTQKVVNQK